MTKKHYTAWFAMARYVMYAILVTFSDWLRQLGEDKWNNLTSYEAASLATSLGLSALVAIGAIMNNRWHEAKNEKVNS